MRELTKCGLLSLGISVPLSAFGYFAAFGIAHASAGALMFFRLIYAPAFFILDRVHDRGAAGDSAILLQMLLAQWAYCLLAIVVCRWAWRIYLRWSASKR